jgi:tetratricopeptide (TPR) repeat protein
MCGFLNGEGQMPGAGSQAAASMPASHGARLAGPGSAGPGSAGLVAGAQEPGDVRNELALARETRAREIVAGENPATIAAIIRRQCEPAYGTTWIRAYRLALGIALADVVAQVRARYKAEGRQPPRFSETLLSAYESGQKRPGPEYLHYLCAVYRADPQDLGYQDRCFCGRAHSVEARDAAAPRTSVIAVAAGSASSPTERADPRARRIAAGKRGPADKRMRTDKGLPGAMPLAVVPEVAAGQGSPAVVLAEPVRARRAGSLDAGSRDADRGDADRGDADRGDADRGDADRGEAGGRGDADRGEAGGRGDADRGEAGGRGDAASRASGDVLRGMLLTLMADAAASPDNRFFGAADHLRRRLDDALLGRTVSVTMLDQWEETTAGYGIQYMSVPPLRLLCDVLLDLGDIRRMCAERQPLESAERLCRLAGQLACLTGMAMINLGDQRLARSFFRTARTAADETGDRRLRAWVAARAGLVPLYYGDPREAAALARAGTDLAGRKPCVAGVMAPVIEARAVARLAGRGRREALDRVRGALDRAHDALGELTAADSASTAFGYTERQLFFHEGDALVTLGDYQGATRTFAHALRLYSPAEFLDRALVMFGEARCLAEADEPEQALRLGRDTLVSLPSQHRTEIVAHAARGLGESVAVRHAGLPALGDYREALHAARTACAERPR